MTDTPTLSVIERCARVVEGFKTEALGNLVIENPLDWPVNWTENLLDQIAAAIRALEQKDD